MSLFSSFHFAQLILPYHKKSLITWAEYEEQYTALMNKREKHLTFLDDYAKYENVCLLCSEPTPEHCHRRLIAEMIAKTSPQKIKILHI